MALTTSKDFRIAPCIAEISGCWKCPLGLNHPVCDDVLMHQLQTISSQGLLFICMICNGERRDRLHQLFNCILLYHSGIAQAETVLSLLSLSPNSISRGRSQGCNHQLRLDSKFKRLKKSGLSGCEKEKRRCSLEVPSSC